MQSIEARLLPARLVIFVGSRALAESREPYFQGREHRYPSEVPMINGDHSSSSHQITAVRVIHEGDVHRGYTYDPYAPVTPQFTAILRKFGVPREATRRANSARLVLTK